LAKVKNFKDEKETIAIAKTPGRRKNRKVIESLPLDWSIKVHSKPNNTRKRLEFVFSFRQNSSLLILLKWMIILHALINPLLLWCLQVAVTPLRQQSVLPLQVDHLMKVVKR